MINKLLWLGGKQVANVKQMEIDCENVNSLNLLEMYLACVYLFNTVILEYLHQKLKATRKDTS